jgi:hypothetical protein
MKLMLLNTFEGLKPCYDADFEEKKKLRTGQVYSAEIKLERNYEFHKKYFALISLAWEYQPEKRQEFFKNSVEVFRKTVEISAGHCDLVYSIKRKEWLEVPKSIAFSKMDNSSFQMLYDNVKGVLFTYFLNHISVEEFEKNLINF